MNPYILYFYDLETGEYLFKKEPQNHPNGQPILDVLGATHTKPPQAKGNRIPKWTGKQWLLVEDNRQVPFWLEGDTYTCPARFIKTLGKLPNTAIVERPPKCQEQQRIEAMQAIQEKITELEQKATRYTQEIAYAYLEKREPEPTDIAQFLSYRKEITKLREAYRELNAH